MIEQFDLRADFDELSEAGATPIVMAIVCNIIAKCFSHYAPKSGARRTREWRDRIASDDVTKNVTNVTSPPYDINNSTPPEKQTRGKRLPENWLPSEDLLAWGKEELGLSGEGLRFETASFCDHFWSSARANAAKKDWDRAWKNWMREASRRAKPKLKAIQGGQFFASPPKRSWAEIKAEREAKREQ